MLFILVLSMLALAMLCWPRLSLYIRIQCCGSKWGVPGSRYEQREEKNGSGSDLRENNWIRILILPNIYQIKFFFHFFRHQISISITSDPTKTTGSGSATLPLTTPELIRTFFQYRIRIRPQRLDPQPCCTLCTLERGSFWNHEVDCTARHTQWYLYISW